MLSPHSQFSLGSFLHGVLDTIVERLGAAGIRVEYEHRPRLFTRHSPGELARLTSLPDTAAWALLFATESMQRWYAERGVPCVVIGRAYPGVELPCVYPDTEAPARHAAGLFVQRGHLELVYFIAEQTSLNDRLGADAFAQEGMRLGANVRIITHPRSASALSRRILAVLAEEPRPTAFFSGCPEHCLTILCHLFNEGFRVPTDASIISGQEDEFLQFALPKFARYRSDGMKLGRKAATMLLNLIRHGRGSRRTISILPEFIPGGTLGRRMPTPAH